MTFQTRVRSRRVKRRADPDGLSPAAEAELHVGPDPAVGSVFTSATALHAAADDLRARQARRTTLWTIRVRQAVRHFGLDDDRPELIRELEAAHRHDQEA